MSRLKIHAMNGESARTGSEEQHEGDDLHSGLLLAHHYIQPEGGADCLLGCVTC